MNRAVVPVLLALAAIATLPSSTRADELFTEVRGWQIVHSDEYSGCIARASYQDGTIVRFGMDGITGEPFINFSNPAWTNYIVNSNYEVKFDAGRRGQFSGYFHFLYRDNIPTLEAGNIVNAFFDAWAAAAGVRMYVEGQHITNFDLSGTRAAINAIGDCRSRY